MIKVLLAYDHAIVREGIRRIIDAESDLHVSSVTGDGIEMLNVIRLDEPEVVVTDVNLTGLGGLDLIRRFRSEYASTPVVILSSVDDLFMASHLIGSGISAYLNKESESEVLIHAIRQAVSGSRYVEPIVATRLLYERGALDADPRARLTRREFQIFMMVANGVPVKEIAEDLHISPKTVSTHKVRLMNKVGAKNMKDLVAQAIKSGYLEC